jgi:hypothetical protein
MSIRKGPKPAPQAEDAAVNNQGLNDEPSRLRAEWDKEANRELDESALRRKPDWLEAIGDEDEGERVEANLEEQWGIRGEDDYVSDPTDTADMPNWVDDDYDDDAPHAR